MGLLHWDEAYSVGHAQLDSEHRVLLGLINRLHELEGGERVAMVEALANLVHYAEDHFRHEESVMAAAAYPGREAHRRLHLRFRQQLNAFLDHAGGEPERVQDELRTFLAAWWRHHVLEEDTRYRPYLV